MFNKQSQIRQGVALQRGGWAVGPQPHNPYRTAQFPHGLSSLNLDIRILLAVPSSFNKSVQSARYDSDYYWYGYYAVLYTVVTSVRILRFESGAPTLQVRASAMLLLPTVGN